MQCTHYQLDMIGTYDRAGGTARYGSETKIAGRCAMKLQMPLTEQSFRTALTNRRRKLELNEEGGSQLDTSLLSNITDIDKYVQDFTDAGMEPMEPKTFRSSRRGVTVVFTFRPMDGMDDTESWDHGDYGDDGFDGGDEGGEEECGDPSVLRVLLKF